MPWAAAIYRPHLGAGFAFEGDLANLRIVETVDDVQHRGFTGAVRTDDRANFALVDIETDILDGVHATERQRHIAHVKHDLRRRCPVVVRV